MQTELGEFFEDVDEALRAAVKAIGDYKKVGPMLRPELKDQAAGWLRDCLNPERREKLSPQHLLLLLSMARQAGYHGAMAFVALDTGYEAPKPLDPEDKAAELQRHFVDAVNRLEAIQRKLETTTRLRAA